MKVAITGGIAEGKSTVLGYLRDLGCEVTSSDDIARQVFERDEVQSEIGRLLGVDPPVDRAAVRAALADPDLRRAINRITHPLIRACGRASLATCFEVPLLIEACLQGEYDRVWVVTCGEQEQLRRLEQRLGSRAEAEAMIRAQLPSRAKIPFADLLIRTNASENAVQVLVSSAFERELR